MAEDLKALLLPERYAERKSDIDFELNVFRRFPKLKDYYLDIKTRGLKVSNKPNSWVAWAIGITDEQPDGQMVIDSASPPDIDLDFSNRDPVVDYMFETYGEDHTAMVGTFLNIKTKYALKDIARWQNGGHLTNEDPVHKITRTIDTAPQMYASERDFLLGFTDEHGHKFPGHLDENKDLRTYLDLNPEVKDLLFKILEKPRSMGKHAGGVVVTPGPIDEVVPTRYFEKRKCTQISHKVLEKIGGMKIDILGVNTLNWIFETIWALEKQGIKLDPWNLPDDHEVWKMVGRGDVDTVFQFDTNTVIPFLKRIKPSSIHDLILITSICRPGGLDSYLEDGDSVAEHFVNRYTGREAVVYLDPVLEPLLGDTYGLIVFQEQIQAVFEVIGGFTPIEADNARRAVGKKIKALIDSLKGKLFEGARRQYGWSLEKCEALWNSFEGAANYSFNRAHACAYAIIAYACAYLKKNHKLEWWRSVLSHSPNEKIAEYLPVVNPFIAPPHVSRPEMHWVIDGTKIVAPISLVMRVGQKAVDEIKLQVATAGPFVSFVDFLSRITKKNANKTVVQNLILAGCFDGLPVCDGEPPETRMEMFLAKLYELRGEEMPEGFKNLSPMSKIALKKSVLTVFTCNFVKEFYGIVSGQSDFSNYRGLPCIRGCPIIANFSKLESVMQSWEGEVCLVGMVESAEKFYYNQKSGRDQGKKKSAVKVLLENDGRKLEFVIWEDRLARIDWKNDLASGKLIAGFGTLRYYRGEVSFNLNSVRVLL